MTTADRPCDRQDQTAQLAMGLLSGTERAGALRHIAGCLSCRNDVRQLSDAADQLVHLAPPAEPPPGFESDVLAAITEATGAPTRRNENTLRKGRGLLPAVVSAAAAAAIMLAAAWAWGPGADSRTWEAAMVTPSGREVGQVRLDDGDPDWLLVSVPGWRRWDEEVGRTLEYRLLVELTNAPPVEIPGVELSEDGAWGATPDFDLAAVESVSIVDSSGRVWCTAHPKTSR